jgi:hypothetical protein
VTVWSVQYEHRDRTSSCRRRQRPSVVPASRKRSTAADKKKEWAAGPDDRRPSGGDAHVQLGAQRTRGGRGRSTTSIPATPTSITAGRGRLQRSYWPHSRGWSRAATSPRRARCPSALCTPGKAHDQELRPLMGSTPRRVASTPVLGGRNPRNVIDLRVRGSGGSTGNARPARGLPALEAPDQVAASPTLGSSEQPS